VRDERGWAIRRARKSLKRTLRKLEIEQTAGRRVEPPGDGDIRLYHCPFQKLEEVAGLEPNSVNLILTDIPFGPAFLPAVSALGAFASRVLVEGGLLVTYSGILYLNQVIRRLDEHLNWSWAAASAWTGEASITRSRNVVGRWKPILIYSKGEWRDRGQWPDARSSIPAGAGSRRRLLAETSVAGASLAISTKAA
jgi:site-specific DNA-methyltransferase (adenine-specific)